MDGIRLTILIVFCLILTLFAGNVNAQIIWNTATGKWETPTNWTPIGVPTSSDNVGIDAGIANVDFFTPAASADIISVGGTGLLNITGGGRVTAATQVGIGHNPANNGTVTVDGDDSELDITGMLVVGFYGHGVLNITDGGLAYITSGSASNYTIWIGHMFGSTGTVTVSGRGTYYASEIYTNGTLQVGGAGDGELNIIGGGLVTAANTRIGDDATGTGTVTVSGRSSANASTLNIGNNIYLGYSGKGTLDIRDGGKVSATNNVYIAWNSGSEGTLTLDGLNSNLSTGQLFIGVGDGGESTGTVTMTGGATATATNVIAGYYGPGNGTITVSGSGGGTASTLNVTTGFLVGREGTGVLNITGGGQTIVTGSMGVQIGYSGTASKGTVTVSGSSGGTASTLRTTATAANINVGASGTGVLNITDGGRAISAGLIYLGYNSGARGTVTVSGNNSTLSTSGGTSANIYIGRSGAGVLNIADGGQAIAGGEVSIGTNLGSAGTVTVSGNNSLLQGGTYITVGDGGGRGTLEITGGGRATAGSQIYIAYNSASVGTVRVEGRDSLMQSTSMLNVGYNGTGTLEITDGGRVTASQIHIGGHFGYSTTVGTGTVTVSGKDGANASTLSANSGIIVGSNRTGVLNVTDGAKVTDNTAIMIGYTPTTSSGTVLVSGNTSEISAPNIQVVRGILAGTGQVTATAAVSNAMAVSTLGTLSPGDTAGATGFLTINGNLTMQPNSTIRVDLPASGTDADRVIVSGTANLTGNLKIDLSSLHLSGEFLILDSAALTSNTFTVTLNGAPIVAGGPRIVVPTTRTDARNLYLTVTKMGNTEVTWTGSVPGDWDLSSVNWKDSLGLVKPIDGDITFLDGDAVAFNGVTGTITIPSVNKTVAQMTVSGAGNLTINGNILADGTLTTLATEPNPAHRVFASGKLYKSGTGTLTLNGANEFKRGVSFTGGTIVLGNDKALGTWVQGGTTEETFMNSQGIVVVTGNETSTIKVDNDRTISNHFVIGNPTVSGTTTGKLVFDIAAGKTLTIDGVVTESHHEWLGNGGAINVDVGGAGQLQFGDPNNPKGHLVFSNNISVDRSGGAVGTAERLASTLDFRGLESITFTGNKAHYAAHVDCDGGAIYSFDKVLLGDNATFRNNEAGLGGGAILANGDITIGKRATFTDNTAGEYGGAIDDDWDGFSISGILKIDTNAYFAGNAANTAAGPTSGGQGGAIRAAGNVFIGGNTYFKDNKAAILGGAIWAGSSASTITLDATSGDIAFSGNTEGSHSNSIYSNGNTTLLLTGNNNFYFDDPIRSTGTGNSLIKTGDGFVQFAFDEMGLVSYYTSTDSVDVQKGMFRISGDNPSGTFVVSGTGTFNVANGATLAGRGTIMANSFTIGGTVSPDKDRFEIPTYVDKNHAEATATNYNYFKGDKSTTVAAGEEIGRLSLWGNTSFSGATFAIDIDSDTSLDVIAVTGNATLGGTNTLAANFLGTPALNVNYTFLTATGTVDDPTGKVVLGRIPYDGYNLSARGSGVFREIDSKSLYLLLALNNIDLTWTGNESGLWTSNPLDPLSGNWTNNNATTPETKFKNGDAVTFNMNDGVTRIINIDPSGVTVADMTVSGNGNWTINGDITGDGTATATTLIGRTGKLLKGGTGTLILNGNNEFKGGTTVQTGTLLVEGTTKSNTVNVANTAILGGLGTIEGTVTFNDGATLSPGNASTPIGTFTIDGDAIFNNSKIAVHTNGTNDKLVVTGDASIVADKMLTLAVASNDAVIFAKTFDFNTTGTLNIDGYTPLQHTPKYLSSENWQLVIKTTDGVKNFNPDVHVNSHPWVDYLSSSARLNDDGTDTEVWVETRLSWYSTDGDPDHYARSHGDFTIDGGEFTLGANLANNNTDPLYTWNRRADWDGTTLTKKGSGTLILTGANTYTGVTTVEAGTLIIGNLAGTPAQISGGATLASGTTLGGHGTIGGNMTLASGATLSPGVGDIGELTVKGNASFASGSTYVYEIDKDANKHDHLDVAGSVSIQSGAKLDVRFLNTTEEDGDRFKVITAEKGFTGMFVPDGTWLRPMFQEIIDQAGSVSGYYEYWIYWQSVVPGFASNISGIGTDNAYRAAVGMDTIDQKGLTGAIADLYNALGTMEQSDPQALAGAFAQLHGEVFASNKEAAAQMQRRFLRQLPTARDRVLDLACDPTCDEESGFKKWNRWASFTGDWLNRGNIGTYSGYDLWTAGLAVGMDRDVTQNTFIGGAFGYDHADQDFRTIRSRDQMDVFRTMLYGGWRNRKLYADGYAGYTRNEHRTRRDINVNEGNVNGFDAVARSKYGDNMFSTGFEVGHKMRFDKTRLTPSMGLHYINLVNPNITETGGRDANLHIYSGTYESLRLPIGTRWNRDYVGIDSTIWKTELRAFYVRELGDASTRAVTSFDGVRDVRFVAESGNLGRNSGRIGASVGTQLMHRLDIRIDYDCEVYEHSTSSEFGATLGVKW